MDPGRRLLHRYLDQLAGADELAELARLLARRPDLAEALAEASRVEAALQGHLGERRVADRALAVLAPPRRRRRLLWCAAAVVFLAVGAAVGHRLARHQEPAPSAVVSGRFLVGGAEVARIPDDAGFEVLGDAAAVVRLPDGSHAELIPASRAVLRGGPRKVVELHSGGGAFHVEKGPKRFQVCTPLGTIAAHDGAFTVELQAAEDEEGSMSSRGAFLLVVAALVGQIEVHSDGRDYVLAPGQSWVFAGGGKPPVKKPSLAGSVVAVSADGKTLTVLVPSPKKDGTTRQYTVRLTARTKLEYGGLTGADARPAVGQAVSVWLEDGSADAAARVTLSVKAAVLNGVVVAVAADGSAITLQMPAKVPGDKPIRVQVQLPAGAKRKYQQVDRGDRPMTGYFVRVWLRPGSRDTASGVLFSSKPLPAETKKPVVKKPGDDKKPGAGSVSLPPVAPVVRPPRDFAAIAAAIDRHIDQRLKEERMPAAAPADDAEFLRRVYLDLTGRIPTPARATAFLDSTAPDKRRKLIDELLASPAYGEHLATLWRHRLVPPAEGVKKIVRDDLAPWLTAQLNANRGWDAIVSDLLTVEGAVAQAPHSAFILANMEAGKVQPSRLTASVGRLFLGVQLQCAECHNHPHARWTQADFQSTAAFFGGLQFTGSKGGTPSLVETTDARGARPRFLGGAEPKLADGAARRPAFARWATAADNPFFARAATNRVWAHFFGRGLVHPVDGLETNDPSHPDLLRLLAKELADSRFDLKHLARCVCNSKAYQRSSRPACDDADPALLGHMPLKVLGAEAFYDAVLTATGRQPLPGPARSDFARLFRAGGDVEDATEYRQGIPQMLQLLNGRLLNGEAPLVDRLLADRVARPEAVTAMFLATLSRRPTTAERDAMLRFLDRRKDDRDGYRGALWVLLNSGEFVLNH